MIVAPIVFCVVVHGIAGAGDLKKVGRVGVKALVYFEVMTTVALVVGLLLAYLFGPGHGMNIDPSTLDAKALNTYADNAHKLKGGGIGSFLLNIIPTTSFDALSRNDVLQVLFFAILFGVSLALVGGEKGERVGSLIDAVSTVLFRVMGLIVRARAARRARRGRLHGRQVRRRLAEAADLAGGAVLRRGRDLRARRARRRDGARRTEHPQVPRLPARGTDHRAGDRVVGRGAAADHAQAGAAWASRIPWSGW